MNLVEGLVGALDKVGARGGAGMVRDTFKAGMDYSRDSNAIMGSLRDRFNGPLSKETTDAVSRRTRAQVSRDYGNRDMGATVAQMAWRNLNTDAPNLLGKRIAAGVGAVGAVGLGVSTVGNFSQGNYGSGIMGAGALTVATAVALASPDSVARGLENRWVNAAIEKTAGIRGAWTVTKNVP